MRGCKELPGEYVPVLSIDMQEDKKLAAWINGLAAVTTVVLCVLGTFWVPFGALIDMEQGFGMFVLRLAVLCVGTVGYIIVHELVHGVFMRWFSGERPNYGFTGLYAYTGSHAYFNKVSYLIIALAPVVILGLVLAALCCVVPQAWFWVVWIIQVSNLGGAMGDLYVTVKFIGLPRDILVQDDGVRMIVYSAQNGEDHE